MDDIEHGLFQASEQIGKIADSLRGHGEAIGARDPALRGDLEQAIEQLARWQEDLLGMATRWHHVDD